MMLKKMSILYIFYFYLFLLIYRREVDLSEGEKMKEDYDFDLFMETSAKNGFNIQELFCQTVKIIYDNFEKENKISYVIYLIF